MQDFIYNLKYKIKFLLSNFGRIIILIFLIFIFLILIYFYQNYFEFGKLKVSFFDIGQGDAIMIETPSHKKIIIDAGPNNNIIAKVESEMNLLNKKIDLAILSHADQDHIAGFISLFKKYSFSKIIWNGDNNKQTAVWQEIKNQINNSSNNQIANCGQEIDFQDGVQMFILHPTQYQNQLSFNPKFEILDSNSQSIVILLLFENYSFLFTGDMTQEIERKLSFNINNCFASSSLEKINMSLKNLTVLKVGHHGSDTSSSDYFLKKIKPEYAVISVANKNQYNLPNLQALERIKKYSNIVFRTDQSGNIKFILDKESFEIKKEY